MKILFNLLDCGLANNGGSDTIVRSAHALTKLGHEVIFIDNIPNKYTWQLVKVKTINPSNGDDIPDADAVIHTGFKTVKKYKLFPKRCGQQLHWIRGWETWTYSEEFIVNNILSCPTIKLVNSTQLQRKLSSYGISSYVVRPGYDFDLYTQLNKRNVETREGCIVGGLYTSESKRKTKRMNWIFEAIEKLKKDYCVALWMFGIDRQIENKIVDMYYSNPNSAEKNVFYNLVDIWVAPTELEGLHRPPAEAMLTECPIVGTNTELNGMSDYLVHGKTGILTLNSVEAFTHGIEKLILDSDYRRRLGINARKQILELGDRATNMNYLIGIIKSYAR